MFGIRRYLVDNSDIRFPAEPFSRERTSFVSVLWIETLAAHIEKRRFAVQRR
jgi:hypothetical protein